MRKMNEINETSRPKKGSSAFHSNPLRYGVIFRSLYKYDMVSDDIDVMLHVSDSCTCNTAIIKHDGKYGVFVLADNDPNWFEPTYWGARYPFIYDDVRISCEGFLEEGDEIGIVAVMEQGKWGIIDVTQHFELQPVVEVIFASFQEAYDEFIAISGRRMRAEWETFESYRI